MLKLLTRALCLAVKLRCVKLRQDSKDVGAFFVAFENKDGDGSILMKTTRRSIKAISVQALSANNFVVLDSDGDVHLLCLSYSIQGLDSPCIVKRLTQMMKVVKLAIFHGVSTGAPTKFLLILEILVTTFINAQNMP